LIPAVKTGILEKFGAVVAVGREHLSAAAGESLIPVPLAPPSESRLLSKEPRTRLKIRSFSSGFEPRESGTATKEPFHRARRTGFSPETLYYPGLDGFGNAHQTEGLAPIGCGRISNPSPTTNCTEALPHSRLPLIVGAIRKQHREPRLARPQQALRLSARQQNLYI
jgi:hypothetical protein